MPKVNPVEAFWWAYFNDMSELDKMKTIEKALHIVRSNAEMLSADTADHQKKAAELREMLK